jgi:hypothetical protein
MNKNHYFKKMKKFQKCYLPLRDIYLSSSTLSDVVLPNNRLYEPWDSFSQFVRAHFLYNREDFYLPFREQLRLFRLDQSKVDYRDLFLFENVKISGQFIENQEAHFYISFSIRWPKNRQTQKQSTICDQIGYLIFLF